GERLRPGELAARRISACVWLDDRRWRDCFSVTGDRTGACIGRGCVVYPDGVSYVPGAPAGPLDEALAAELVDSLNASKRAIVEDLPPLSDVLSEGFPDWGSGYERARLAFEGISARVSDRRRAVRQAVSALEGDTAALASGLERARSLISVIEQSGSSFTTPLGPLPVGIRELVFLYPALLGVAYLLCLASFRRLVTLRRVFHLLTLEVGGEEATQGPLSVSLTAPLWYEPLDARWSQAGNLILALAPLVLMVWSYLALRLGLAALVDGADSRLAPVWYDLFFWVACIGVGLAFARAAWTVRSYRARPPGSFAS
ncbi:MAG TPA: hypothetical protein VLA09_09375, partial [Longimicrobiales bacterium]|nr:hypothetical protein [Longimicrobiales bacterium]